MRIATPFEKIGNVALFTCKLQTKRKSGTNHQFISTARLPTQNGNTNSKKTQENEKNHTGRNIQRVRGDQRRQERG